MAWPDAVLAKNESVRACCARNPGVIAALNDEQEQAMRAGPSRDRRKLIIPSVAILVTVMIGAAIWTAATRDWNASGTQKAGSPHSSAPSEGGRPLMLNR